MERLGARSGPSTRRLENGRIEFLFVDIFFFIGAIVAKKLRRGKAQEFNATPALQPPVAPLLFPGQSKNKTTRDKTFYKTISGFGCCPRRNW
jgi:hypothetical protein